MGRVADLTDLRRLIQQKGADVRNRASAEVRDQLRDSARETHGRQEYVDESGASTRTGAMERGIIVSPKDDFPNDFTIIAESRVEDITGRGVPYDKYVNDGTEPHEIKARRAPALVFFWPGPVGPNQVVAFKRVKHPGFRGDGWFDRVVSEDNWREISQRAWDESRVGV